ncbi:MAG: acetolactate synthase small subunit [Candidatus Omnitrophota bacterium]|nr:MAG: acetolactate synthase small subunit [Candidatus Omnitrophota bacterium]
MKHIILALVENRPGVLARMAGLFSARGFNIDSLTVGETEDPTISRMTIVVRGDDRTLEQVKKQLNKLIDTISVKDFVKKEFIDRELMLFKVNVDDKTKDKVKNIIEKSKDKIVKISKDYIIVEAVGDENHIKTLLSNLEKYGITHVTRTGRIAMAVE